ITKKDMFNGIIATLTENFGDDVAEYVEFLEGEVAALDKRAEKEKERRAAKKAEGDELKDAVKAAIGEKPATAEEIANALEPDFPEITKAKVTYRATALVKEGEIFKVTIKNEEGKKAVAYTTEAPAEDEE
ncbi:MAG TPA: hypothetical protein DCL29_02005, partial [Eubacterium sp.]|nr:hypothetical protein [Eubacterium sp.]